MTSRRIGCKHNDPRPRRRLVELGLLSSQVLFFCALGCQDGCPFPSDLSETPTLDTAIAKWEDELANTGCFENEGPGPYAVVGQCEDENNRFKFLLGVILIGYDVLYFDDETQEVVDYYTSGDIGDPVCQGQFFGHKRYHCAHAVVTKVICGNDRYDEGDEIDLP